MGLRLPKEIAFNHVEPEFPELIRVGNVKTDGTMINGHRASEYWHMDGNFWPHG